MKFLLYAITLAAMTLTVPWFFSPETTSTDTEPTGIPVWVVYNVAASILYAALVATFLRFFWDTSAEGSDSREPTQHENRNA